MSKLKKYILIGLLVLVVIFTVFIVINWDNFYRIKKVELHHIECDKKSELLDSVYQSDQRLRKTKVSFKEFVEVGHENLETVLSILEDCGMSTLDEVTQRQLDAIWLSIQHAPQKDIRKKYLHFIESSVERGDLPKEKYAVMKDRILMDDGKPQLYGSQVKSGKLYKLDQPEKVNKRREEMGMGPIEPYLRRYNIKFEVKQVE